MSLSQRIILKLKSAYEKYAFHEEIKLSGGKDLVIFEYRDTVFENELNQFGFRLQLRPALHPRKDLYMGAAAKLTNKRHYKEFDLSPSITIKHIVIRKPEQEVEKVTVSPMESRVVEQRTKERKPVVPVNPVKPKEPIRITVKVEGAEIDNSF